MGKVRRVGQLIRGLLLLACAIVLPTNPKDGLLIAAALLGISLTVYGIRMLVYYFTMARHMVGGLRILFLGLIAFDMGAFSPTLMHHPRIIIVLYLISVNILTGVAYLMRAIEARGLEGSWKRTFTHGIVYLIHALNCLLFIGNDFVIIILFSIGLLYSAYAALSSAFKETDIIYIQ